MAALVMARFSALIDRTKNGEAAGAGRDDERGQGMVEYALILVLIAIVVIVIISVVGQQVNNVFSNISNGLSQ